MSRGQTLAAEVEALERKKPFFGKRGHQQATADKMIQCANAYRAERDFVHSGEMYMRAARLAQELDEFTTATKAATDAAHMYAKDQTYHTETMAALQFGIDLFKAKEKLFDAAQLLAELSRVLIDEGSVASAVDILKEAVALYKEANAIARAAALLEQIADLLAEKGEYVASVEFYREVADIRLGNAATQGSSGYVFFKAMLVTLQANDLVGARAKLDAYLDKNPTWKRDQFCQFIMTLLDTLENHEIEKFDDACELFRRRNSVDQWLSNRLLDLRKFADGDEGGLC
jgi:tetratricopeptide (TPR) repeat protein